MTAAAKRTPEKYLKICLEFYYTHGLLEEAILIGNLLDKMQCMMLEKLEQSGTVCYA